MAAIFIPLGLKGRHLLCEDCDLFLSFMELSRKASNLSRPDRAQPFESVFYEYRWQWYGVSGKT